MGKRPKRKERIPPYNHTHRFRAVKPTRVFVAGRNKVTIFVVNLDKGKHFQLRKGQKFYGERPSKLREVT